MCVCVFLIFLNIFFFDSSGVVPTGVATLGPLLPKNRGVPGDGQTQGSSQTQQKKGKGNHMHIWFLKYSGCLGEPKPATSPLQEW